MPPLETSARSPSSLITSSEDVTYVFIDESGNMDFAPTGTQYFVLTSVSMNRPFPIYRALDAYRYDRLEQGFDCERFHCSEDSPSVRQAVFDRIASELDGVRIDCLVVAKTKVDPALQDERRFYPEMLSRLLRSVLQSELSRGAESFVIITDALPVRKMRRAHAKGVQLAIAEMLPANVDYRVLHHASASHYGLQVADYCSWAVYRKWQRNETAYYDILKDAIRIELEAVEAGAPAKNE